MKWQAPDNPIVEYELYEHEVDPQENFNLINEPHYKRIAEKLKVELNSGKRNVLIDNSLISTTK
ncbi:hypothetical protein ALGA_0934 [Labilibaculum antarcticum]|uniref:N-sulphoglucosamine sulphohydrolase C-terminal domain-containing protein n=1 Tax=Labilibaculum antarcticum TaxID=1717717 RepID=A0A1Y1CJ70_9BACT|nr:hypothetical protein ALGA_0934 [Labilibaculum antarcticum]